MASTTICEQFAETVERYGEAVALRTLDGRSWTWAQYDAAVREAAAGLAGLGLVRGDVLACWLGNRPHYHIADAAAIHLGAASLSLYASAGVEIAERMLADAGARILVTEPAHVERAIAVRARGRTAVDHIVCIDGSAPQALGWDELLDAARPGFDFESAWLAVAPDDLATLTYTAGTTGTAKGVELTHGTIARQGAALRERLAIPDRIGALSLAPMADVTARMSAHYLPILGGWEVICCQDGRAVPAAIRATRPGYLFAAPRVWERLRLAVRAGADPLERAAIEQAMERTRRGAGPQDGEFQKMIGRRAGLDRLRVALVGGAPSSPELIAFWHACGVPLSELYGLSETAGATAVAPPGEGRIGIAGPPLPGCEVRIAPGGEIYLRGPGVTRTALAGDGWLHTGDAGELDPDDHLRVVDRLQELIVSETGTSMSPAHIEAVLRAEANLIGQACVIGNARAFNVALLTVDGEALRAFARSARIRSRSPIQHPRVIEAISGEVARANAQLSPTEQIRRFALLSEQWPAGGDELTPASTLKRRAIAAKYATTIEALYDRHEQAISIHTRPPLASADPSQIH